MAKARDIPGLHADLSYREAATRTVDVRSRELFDYADNVLDTSDIERVHDMRVATRRLRAVLEIYEPCFPRKQLRAVLNDVKDLADALGERRDPDVQLAQLDEFAAAVKPADRLGVELFAERVRSEQGSANSALAAAIAQLEETDLRGRLAALALAAAAQEDEPEAPSEPEPQPEAEAGGHGEPEADAWNEPEAESWSVPEAASWSEPQAASEPADPVEPASPVESASPVEPASPVESASPVEPASPVESASPVEPASPAPPDEPRAPVQPAAPRQPSSWGERAEPSEYEDPTEPAPPAEPAHDWGAQ